MRIPSVAFPGKFSATPARYERAPPLLGADTLEALGDWLGMGEAELSGLQQRRVIEARR